MIYNGGPWTLSWIRKRSEDTKEVMISEKRDKESMDWKFDDGNRLLLE